MQRALQRCRAVASSCSTISLLCCSALTEEPSDQLLSPAQVKNLKARIEPQVETDSLCVLCFRCEVNPAGTRVTRIPAERVGSDWLF